MMLMQTIAFAPAFIRSIQSIKAFIVFVPALEMLHVLMYND